MSAAKRESPGVVEEIVLTVRAGKPLYMLGAFGGAARLVADLLEGEARLELTTPWCEANVGGWPTLAAEYIKRGHEPHSHEAVVDELRTRGSGGLATALGNGRSESENRELINTSDARRAVALVLGGLAAVGGGAT